MILFVARFFFIYFLGIQIAQAACTSPAGVAGTIRFDSVANILYYCNDTNWVQTGGGSGLTSVSGTAPVASSGGTTPDISLNLGNGLTTSGSNLTLNLDTNSGLEFNGASLRFDIDTGIFFYSSDVTVNYGANDATTPVFNEDAIPTTCTVVQRLAMVFSGTKSWACAADNSQRIQGRDVASTAPTTGQILIWDSIGSVWEPATDTSPPTYPSVATETSTFTVGTTEDNTLYHVSGTFTVNLPAVSTVTDGFRVHLKRIGSGTITIDPDGSETIDGATTRTISEDWQYVSFVDTGAEWSILGGSANGTISGCEPGSKFFDEPGSYSWTVTSAQASNCTFTITIKGAGGGAGDTAGGVGGGMSFNYTAASAGILSFVVGGKGIRNTENSRGGFNGGGGGSAAASGGGGGATAIKFDSTLLGIAGGGGGGGYSFVGGTGGDVDAATAGGGNGTTTGGGAGGSNTGGAGGTGSAAGGAGGSSSGAGTAGGGSGGAGGAANATFSISGGGGGGNATRDGGGGGAGYGGGGGGAGTGSGSNGSGGGGGGGYVNTGVVTGQTSVTGAAANTNGSVFIEWN